MDKTELIEIGEVIEDGIILVKDDQKIVDYLIDWHGSELMKAFENRPENTGVSVFFHAGNYKDLVVAVRTKGFHDKERNGIMIMIIEDLYCRAAAKETLIRMIKSAYDDNPVLAFNISKVIEMHMKKAIEMNA